MSGIFSLWQPQYAKHGVATFPIENKIPCVRGWQNVGLNGSSQLAMKFADANAFGFQCGARNRITLIDIDSSDASIVNEAVKLVGESPIIWRTGSGNYAMPFRHNGEARRIRPVAGLPIDVLGGGYAVAPPSMGYAFLQGSLADLDRLPGVRFKGDLVEKAPGRPVAIEGERNTKLFRHCVEQAQYCDTCDDLVDVAKTFNHDECQPSLADSEVVKTAGSAWKHTLGGKKRHGMVSVPRPAIEKLLKSPDALALLTFLSALNGRSSSFWIANGMAGKHLGLTLPRFVRARKHLIEMGIIKLVRRARPGLPAHYRWGQSLGCSFIGDLE